MRKNIIKKSFKREEENTRRENMRDTLSDRKREWDGRKKYLSKNKENSKNFIREHPHITQPKNGEGVGGFIKNHRFF